MYQTWSENSKVQQPSTAAASQARRQNGKQGNIPNLASQYHTELEYIALSGSI